jgi:hypothetical protein
MRTAERLDTHASWAAAQERRRLCATPDCTNPRQPEEAGALCLGCTLEAELFDREARWTAARR